MECLDLTLPTAAENLALDEALLLEAEEGSHGEVLRFWELPSYAVILGSAGRLLEDVDEAACTAEGVPVLRRCSGGGTVLLGPGCLVFSLILSFDRGPLRDVTHSYVYILERISAALAAACPGARPAGSSDVAWRDLKVSGNSQRRMRTHLLHHGTLLYNFDQARVGRYIHLPVKQPEYRRGRPHDVFLTNLPLSAADLKDRLRTTWDATELRTAWPEDQVRQLVATKYGTSAWTRRRL